MSDPTNPDDSVTDGSAGRPPLTVGFLHLGSDRGGIHRDGRMLATRLRERPGLRVVECAVDVTDAGPAGLRKLARAARALAIADVTIVPYSPNRLWAPGRSHLVQLVLTLLISRPVTVVHDVYPSRRWFSRNWWALAACGLLSRAVVFHEQHEVTTLETVPRRGRLFRVPLPVEAVSLPPRARARAQLGVSESAGFSAWSAGSIPRKNCERAIEVARATCRRRLSSGLSGRRPPAPSPTCGARAARQRPRRRRAADDHGYVER